MEIRSTSPKQTKEAGKNLAKKLNGGDVVALFGELGAGKTNFVQGLAQGFGIKERVISPTFVFMRSYKIKKDQNILNLIHIDLYRINEARDFKLLGLEDIFNTQNIVVLEWAEKVSTLLPKKRTEVLLEKKGEFKRKITVKEKK